MGMLVVINALGLYFLVLLFLTLVHIYIGRNKKYQCSLMALLLPTGCTFLLVFALFYLLPLQLFTFTLVVVSWYPGDLSNYLFLLGLVG